MSEREREREREEGGKEREEEGERVLTVSCSVVICSGTVVFMLSAMAYFIRASSRRAYVRNHHNKYAVNISV